MARLINIRVVQKAIKLSALAQKKLSAAILVGQYIAFKALSDAASTLDAVAKAVGKYFSDAAGASDALTKDIGKGPVDVPVTTDSASIDVDKSLSDTSSAEDSTFIASGKSAADSGLASDSLAIHPNKAAQDSSATSDAINFDTTKAPVDIAQLIDSASFSAIKALADTVYSTDDVGGEASVDDDQYVSFFKNHTDLGFVSETLQKAVDTIRSDAAGVTDLAGTHPNKGVQDLASTIDSIITDVSKRPQDTSFVSDILVFLLTAERDLVDSAAASDLVNVLISKPFSDAASMADMANSTVTKGQYDTLSVADSGLAFWQDYVDNPYYFAEDYIGTSQPFN